MNRIRKYFREKSRYPVEKIFSLDFDEKVLIVAPHPDDESIGCGQMLVQYGPQCEVLLLTDGRFGNPEWSINKCIETRIAEFQLTMKQAGIGQYICLNKVDGEFKCKDVKESGVFFDKYHYIFVPNKHDNHPDHKETYKAFHNMKKRGKIKGLLVQYEIWSAMCAPNCYLPYESYSNKALLIENYKCQLKHIDYISRIEGLNRYRGMLAQSNYAEAYYIEPHWKQNVSYFFFGGMVKIKKKIFGDK